MRRLLMPVVVTLGVAIAWILAMPEAPVVAQPIAFNHAKHGSVGCAVCHAGVTSGLRAGIPQGDVCLRCHATAPPAVTAAVWTDVTEGRPIAWRQITLIPDHVRFSHRRHTQAGQIACSSCHGDMQTRTTPPTRVATRLVMTTCLSCHKREGATEDCAGCHR